MRRITITLAAAAMLLAFAPVSALARHHHRSARHHRHHARIEHFGDVNSTPTGSNSADNAGTVQSFSDGRLTILLNDGSTVSGRVTRDTELECMAPENQAMHEDGDTSGDDPSGDGGGDTSGSDDQAQSSGDQTSGDDDAAEANEDQAEEQNENEAAEENEDEMENNCSTSSLTSGTVVHAAELRLSSTGSFWKKVELES